MVTSVVGTFTSKLDEIDVAVSQIERGELAETIDRVVRTPAVGVPVDVDGGSLPDVVEVEPTVDDVRAARTGVTPATLGIAEYGSVVLEADPFGSEVASLFPELHVAVLRESDVVGEMREAFEWLGPRLREDRSSEIIATGPSATADMGGLVRGAHGPEAVHVILLADRVEETVERGSETEVADE
ncbi:L-lactate dehydrogenase complex protein LldG [Halalkaliarchaeum desulfuricum]|uniref:L-lactate dehydrogenase complex protein LldG n=2 Tax=Halalkaliarchaeum desulfuricum TaxID=2055893 RepID=A0A343TGZ8_9EURY|nr:L-lactate dehydrogenase complex protein LldG [Halalkaliarchaeum desulfuricum]